MIFWAIIALMTCIACLLALMPFWHKVDRSKVGERSDSTGYDQENVQEEKLRLYRHQLHELEEEHAQGGMNSKEMEAARAEIARHLLAASEEPKQNFMLSKTRHYRAVIFILITIPTIALGSYWVLGKPMAPDQPLTARLKKPPVGEDIYTLVARTEAYLLSNPDDARGWDVIAPVYMRMQRYDKAVDAYRNIIRLNGQTAGRLSDFGEALTLREKGRISKKTQDVFKAAIALDKKAVKARFFLALALSQEKRKKEAITAWKALIDDANGKEAWLPLAHRHLASLEHGPEKLIDFSDKTMRKNKKSDPSIDSPKVTKDTIKEAPSGPTSQDIKAAAEMDADSRQHMINDMVNSLAERLENDPNDRAGWLRLIRSYAVLGHKDKALQALASARHALKNEVNTIAELDQLAEQLQLTTSPN